MTGTLTTSLNHPESGLGPLTILKWRSSVITTRIIPQIDTEFWYKILWIWTHLITIITHKKVMRNGVLAAWPFWNCKRALPQCYMVQGRGQSARHQKHPPPCLLHDQLMIWFFKGNTISMDHHHLHEWCGRSAISSFPQKDDFLFLQIENACYAQTWK